MVLVRNDFNFLKERDLCDLKQVVVFGAGQYGIITIYFLQKKGIDVIACMDNDAQKTGKMLWNHVVCIQPRFDKNLPVIVAVKNEELSKRIYRQCREMGYTDIIFIDNDAIDSEIPKLSDQEYLDIRYAKVFDGKAIDWDNPRTFNEKMQWLKLYDRNPRYTDLVDKYEFKKHIESVLGEEYVIKTLGVWDSVDKIEWDILPNQFVLKCTHDSGSVVICRDKSSFDIEDAINKLKRAYDRDFYMVGREWPYKDVKRRIIAEQYMQDAERRELRDYKFYCFGGVPKFLYISEGLENHKTARISYIDIDDGKWEFAPFRRTDYHEFEELPPIPDTYQEMCRIAQVLSKGYPFVRVDLYEVNGKVYPSELTFTPGAGFTEYEPEEWNYKLGDMLKLPQKQSI